MNKQINLIVFTCVNLENRECISPFCSRVCLCVCVFESLGGYLRTQGIWGHATLLISRKWREALMSAKCEEAAARAHSLAWCVFTATQSIYSKSMVLSLHNHISADLKSHTCCNAIYLGAGFIASNSSPGELCISLCFVCFRLCSALCVFVSLCLCVCMCVSILI